MSVSGNIHVREYVSEGMTDLVQNLFAAFLIKSSAKEIGIVE